MATAHKLSFAVLVLVILSQENTLSFHLPLKHNFLPSIPVPLSSSSERSNSTGEISIYNKGCPWCRGSPQTSDQAPNKSFSENEIRQIRLELIKDKILSKLDLREAPTGAIEQNSFPSLVTEGKVPGVSVESDLRSPSYYEESSLSSILVADSRFPCSSQIKSPSSCFKFNIKAQDLSGPHRKKEAKLWLWKKRDNGDRMPQMITVSQMFWNSETDKENREFLISYQVTNVTRGWISLNISWSQNLSNPFPAPYLYLRISCPTCKGKRHHHPIASSLNRRPFLVIENEKNRNRMSKKIRQKRAIGDCSHNTQRCCRDSLYVDFAELGWNNWILQPPGFTMYYCKGSCADVTASSVHRNGNTYSALLQRLMLQPDLPSGLRGALAPCCSAGHKEPLSILWVESPGTNTVSLSVLPDMIVTSCDCNG